MVPGVVLDSLPQQGLTLAGVVEVEGIEGGLAAVQAVLAEQLQALVVAMDDGCVGLVHRRGIGQWWNRHG